MFEFTSLLFSLIDLFAIAGGGGSGGGGGGGGGGGFSGGSSSGGSGSGSPWVLVIFLIVFGLFWYFSFMAARKAAKLIKERQAKVRAGLAEAAAKDVIWEADSIEAHAKDTFIQYQKDWSVFNLDSMKRYMTPEYYQHNLLMMGALKLHARQNDVRNPVVNSAEVMDFTDSPDNNEDKTTVKLSVHVFDALNDTRENKQLFAQYLATTEYYKFIRSGKSWKFAGIDQATADPSKRNISLEEFARKHGYFYSLDWGHLLIPKRGQLFRYGTFGVSDINNHVIGLYKDIIIQLYTYAQVPGSVIEYLIAQTSVPKSYGNIIVRNKKSTYAPKVKKLRKLKMEWQDFNNKYEVYASDENLATSFELLHPAFMEQLEALPFEVSIEVVDNIVYLYTSGYGLTKSENYETMLTILKAAFKEMRM